MDQKSPRTQEDRAAAQFLLEKADGMISAEEIKHAQKIRVIFHIAFYSAFVFAGLLVVEFVLIFLATVDELLFLITLSGLCVSCVLVAFLTFKFEEIVR